MLGEARCFASGEELVKALTCKRSGRCYFEPVEGSCAASELCRPFGRCAPGPDADAGCVARDRSGSELRTRPGACRLAAGRCGYEAPPTQCALEEVEGLVAVASSAQVHGFQRRDRLGDLQALNGLAGHALVEAGPVTILSVSPGLPWDDVAVSEVRAYACARGGSNPVTPAAPTTQPWLWMCHLPPWHGSTPSILSMR